ncbi:unnamed protein product [Sphagnum jensenii]|uniref:Myb-like domain-containing protein n=1 Tax=Sphagnum jensenii TaxID=128206 RepID=A0ABP1AP11_9BRYO
MHNRWDITDPPYPPASQFVVGRPPPPPPHNIFGLSPHDHHVSMSLQQSGPSVGGAHHSSIYFASSSSSCCQLSGPSSKPALPAAADSTRTPTTSIPATLSTSTAAAAKCSAATVGPPLGMDDEESRGTGAGNRWPRRETLALIKIRAEMDSNFRDSGLKGPLWEDVSRKLGDLGYQRSAKKCKEKFENIHKYYKKTKDGRAGRQDGKNYRFFSELEAIYGGGAGQHMSSSHAPAAAAPQLQHHVAGPDLHGSNAAAAAVLLMGTTAGGFHAAPAAAAGLVDGTPVSRIAAAQRTIADKTAELSASGVTLTDSSEDDYEELAPVPAAVGGAGVAAAGPENHDSSSKKKRKRLDDHGKLLMMRSSSRSSKLKSLQSVVKKLMDQQEVMQRKFLEAIERREQDRMVREEASKRQEMARLTRDHELRAQQHAVAASRDAALVAFLQKIVVTTPTTALQLQQIRPPAAAPLRLVATPAAPAAVVRLPGVTTVVETTHHDQSTHQAAETEHQQEKDQEAGSSDPNSNRWPKPEVNDLIRLRSGMETRFQEAGPKAPLWEEISSGMSRLGYNRNAKRCKEKWENINKYFKKTKESNKQRPENAKTCPYFHQLDTLYRQGVLTPTSKASNKLLLLGQQSDQHLSHGSGSDHHEQQLLDHHIPAIPTTLAAGEHADNAHVQQQQPDADQVLSILPPAATAAEGVATTAASGTNNGGGVTAPEPAAQFFSSPGDNGSSADRGAGPTPKKQGVMQQQLTPR